MKTATLYHKASGGIIGRITTADDADLSEYETATVGVIAGNYDATAVYIVAGAPQSRADATMPAPITVTVGEVATVTGLPDPCWIMTGENIVASTGGTYSFTPPFVRVYTGELLGQWRGQLTVTAESAESTALTADPRWQALQNATPQQIEDWLTTNVTTLASARQVLKILLLAVRKLGA